MTANDDARPTLSSKDVREAERLIDKLDDLILGFEVTYSQSRDEFAEAKVLLNELAEKILEGLSNAHPARAPSGQGD